jgi:hypothetical protein
MTDTDTLTADAAGKFFKAAGSTATDAGTEAAHETLSTAAQTAADSMAAAATASGTGEGYIAAVMAAPVGGVGTDFAPDLSGVVSDVTDGGASDFATGSGVTGYFGNFVKGLTTAGRDGADTLTDITDVTDATATAVDTAKSTITDFSANTIGAGTKTWGSRFFAGVSEAYKTASQAASSASNSAWEWAQENPNYAAGGVTAATAATALGTALYVYNKRAEARRTEQRTRSLESMVSKLQQDVNGLKQTLQPPSVPGRPQHTWMGHSDEKGMLGPRG